MELGIAASRFDITLDLFERGSELAGWVEYAADLYDEATMDRFLTHYIHLLQQVVKNPEALLSELSILTELERHQLLVEWNQTRRPYPAGQCVHEVFQEHALRFPQAIAVASGEGGLSYGELEGRANRCAHFLREHGVGPEKIVGIYTERSADMVVAMLAVLKAGGMYLPLDVSLPPARIDFMIEDSGAQIVLSTRRWAAAMQSRRAPVFCVDDAGLFTGFSDRPVDRAVSGVSAGSGAYTIYTSGSTGQPKGVINTHAGLVNLCRWHAEAFGTERKSRCTLIASIGFDAAVWELWATLLAGACAVPVDDTTRATPHLLTELMRGQRITHCFIPTGLLEAMAGTGTFSGPDLQVILCGGDKLSRYCLPAESKAKLFNCYGPTEAAVVATAYEMKPESAPLIGRPIANVQAYVLNGKQELQPIGVIGELYIGGASLGRGYIGRGGLTAEHFVANPFGMPGSRLYATGDRVRYLADGNLEYRGRVDQQVKVRGFRIEPGEVETVLLRHPAVREAAVVVREERGDKMLVAYLVAASDDAAPDSQTLREFLKKGLPEYMIPAAFVLLPALPLTPHGKVDRQRLPEPELGDELEYVAPRTPTEEVLAKVWTDVLKLERVGIHDNFFELGGMSMTALRVVDQAAQAGLVFMPTDLFEFQTIAELAARFSIGPTEATQASQHEGEAPLTPIQHMFMRESPQLMDTFTIFAGFEAAEPLRPAWLREAVKYVAAHHDALAVQITRDTRLIQRILPAEALQYDQCFTEVNLSQLDASQEASIFREIGSAARRRVTAAEPPLLHAVLINRGPGQPQQFLLVTHHFVTDNWSIQILLEDIQTVYQQLAAGQAPLLPRKTTSFKTWTERLTAYAHSEEFERDVAVWDAQQWSDYGKVPLDYPKREYELGSDETLSLKIDRNETDSLLDNILREQRAQSTEVFLAALAETMLQWTGKPAVGIDMLSAGRATCFPGLNVARTVGWFSAPVPVLLQKEADLDPTGMLRQVKSRVRNLPNEGLAYGIGKFLLERDAALVSMPQVCLNNWGGQSNNDSLFRPSSHVFYDDPEPGTFKRHHLIDLVITTGTQALGMHWSFSRNLHRRETIAKLAENYIANLRRLSGGKMN